MKLQMGATTFFGNCNTKLEDVSVHGLHQLFHSDSKFMRFFWLFVLTACVSLLFYETHQIVDYYNSYPKATRVSWVTADQYDYPDLAFSTKRWINLENVKKYNLSDNAVSFLISMIEYDIQTNSNYSEWEARAEVQRIMWAYNFSSNLELVKSLAFSGKDILRHIGPQPLSIEPFVPYMFMAYRLIYPKINATMLRYQIRLNFEYSMPSPDTAWIYDWDTSPLLVIRESSGVKMDPIIFNQNGTYRIFVDFQIYKRINTNVKPCLKQENLPEDYYIQFCEQKCVERGLYEANCSRCIKLSVLESFRTEDNYIINLPPCHFFASTNTSNVHLKSERCNNIEDGVYRSCSKGPSRCLPECDEKKYQYSTTMLSTKPVDKLEIWLTLNPFDGILTLEEVPTYTFDTFVSNVGGQLGLWLGASVVSVIQTVLCILSFLFGKRRVKSQQIAENANNENFVLNNKDADVKTFYKNSGNGKKFISTDLNATEENDHKTVITLWPPVELKYAEDANNTV